MVKKIIHASDIHIRNIKRHEEYKSQLKKFIEECQTISSDYEFNEVRIVLAGDILHSKIEISNEVIVLLSWFFKELDVIAPTIIIAGNHDFLENNKDRLDSITPIISMLSLKNVRYLDMELNYKSGCVVDDNITWCLYSIFDGYNPPDVKLAHVSEPNNKMIGLFHGMISGGSNDNGYVFEHGVSTGLFDGCNAVLCGDIHKRLEFNNGDCKIVMPSSLIQQDVGENVSKHGFLLWDVETLDYEEYDIQNEYGFYKFKIDSIEMLEEGLEEFINF